jgi:chromosomal replication initiation ATPase DnaA
LPSQLVLPLPQRSAATREDFIVTPANAAAVAFIDSWPKWVVGAAALYGPSGSGKSHLAGIWCLAADVPRIPAADLVAEHRAPAQAPLVVEDVDSTTPTLERDRALFALFEQAGRDNPILLTGREPPAAWAVVLPDLASRFSAVLTFPLWAPDDALLAGLARKLFSDRQLAVPDAVISRMLHSLERSPGAFRDFVARADAKALAEGRPVNLALIRDMLA